MVMPERQFDPTRCPDCGRPHGGGVRCAGCGLALTGPLAVELWDVETSIARLGARRSAIIARLRAPAAVPVWSTGVLSPPMQPRTSQWVTVPATPVAVPTGAAPVRPAPP